ncbi:AAA family ATPase [Mesorhizobium sp. P16.1]|uniref:AAA family ATPase n=1 Tax=unclassified Mesorhizobium TaxID=325217 RepID=UPI0021A6B05F|nr:MULTISPECIES: AAA family ATPase [unclassified Mesorhizobium]MCT2580946.1 AAA family ATPase [Mesorhizobium sp. P13.3]MDF3169995.1 AAA family ATPase [Mesorhizobium sp. P16.1]MDF3181181.1 AAA family ATPase [Mesorhizobium sp. P17.1]MDF3186874.1 AAA family ATPase [Mesorhizobium sp. ICCV3110.1]
MEHFAVIQSIIRAGFAGDREALDKQVLRLRERLEKAGENKEASTLDRLRASARDTQDLAPSRVEMSRGKIVGELLEPGVNPPIDRETGARLCTIDFPSGNGQAPVYAACVMETVEDLLNEWSNQAALQAVGVAPTRSLLIYGPPGSGKTVTAHYIAARLGLPLITARIDGLISSFLGTTARNIANLFDFANRYACVLLLDEFDALAKLRDDPQEIGEIKRVVNTLLQNLDLRTSFGITIAITNHDRLLDPAVWRRFETQLQLAEPDEGARENLIARFLEPIATPASTLRVFSYCLEGRTGADIERICMAVKRTLALSRESHDGPGLFHALSSVLARTPYHDHVPARILATDQEAFISLIANDGALSIKQTEIGEATGYGQSRVSDLKKAKRHLPLMEASHAQ